jgi:septation ring formation regulator EzrA
MEKRIAVLTDSIEVADAKAALFGSECQRMKQRLMILNEQKESQSRELSETRQLLQTLRDELNTNVRNYETQLETMSEHLATMNDKWSKQQIEIDSLRQNINQRVSHHLSDWHTFFIHFLSYDSLFLQRSSKPH